MDALSTAGANESPVPASPLQIILLEDADSDAELIGRTLHQGELACVVQRAATRAAFLTLLAQGRPDCVLADYALPGFDGGSALVLLQQHYPDVPFILVSGALGDERAVEILKLGAHDYVLKDRLSRLVPAIRRALAQAAEHRQRQAVEAALQAQTALYATLLQAQSDLAEGVVVLDGDKLVYVNDAFGQIVGYPRPAVNLPLLRGLGILEEGRSADARAPGAEIGTPVERTLIHASGQLVVVEIATKRLGAPDQRQVIWLVRDITARKQAEAELQAANARQTAWIAELEARNREMGLLREMGELLQTCQSTAEIGPILDDFLPRLFPEEAGAVCLCEGQSGLVETVLTWGDVAGSTQIFSADACWALRRGQLHAVADLLHGLRCLHVPAIAGVSSLCVPLLAQNRALGILHVRRRGPEAARWGATDFSDMPSWQRRVIMAADYLKLELANLQLREMLRRQAIRDVLTGLFNRRYMEETLRRELHRASRAGTPLGVLILDIDYFKQVNDRYGHPAGDAVLQHLGLFLQSHTRASDVACRLGGEEFVLILPEAPGQAAARRAEELRAQVQELRLFHAGQPLDPITLSLGVAVFPDHGDSGPALLGAADAALYQAKQQGRNRVVVAGAPAGAGLRTPAAADC